MVLYFGSRHRALEYLYGEELEAYHASGLLTHLRLAFSRDQREKVYIQHKYVGEGGLWSLRFPREYCAPEHDLSKARAATQVWYTALSLVTHPSQPSTADRAFESR